MQASGKWFTFLPILILLLLSSGPRAQAEPFVADCLGKGSLPIEGAWQFHLGDDASWAQPGFDDTTGQNGWESIQANAPWGTQTHANYSGYAWYRRQLHITPAPAASPDISLLIPAIDDVYEIYWNGKRIGGLGSFPPHLKFFSQVAPQRFELGAARDGVLAIRVLKLPFVSNDDGTAGGFEQSPFIGSPDAIHQLQDAADYKWLRNQQFLRGLTTLYVLTALLSFVAWYRNRSQRLLFWLSAYTFIPLLELFLNNMRLPVNSVVLTMLAQTVIQVREMTQWFLLAYLLQLDDSARLMRSLRILAWIVAIVGAVDGSLGFLLTRVPDVAVQLADGTLTALMLPPEVLPAVLVLIAVIRRKQLDAPRWLVSVLACLSATWYAISNIAAQGVRFTHWTLAARMTTMQLNVFGTQVPVLGVLRLLLFLAIVYAVVRYATAYRQRQSALEQEYQSAQELQKILVPEILPEIPGFRLTSAYRPAQEVGGDFFQIVPLEGEHAGSTLIVLGDVSGKGLQAAMTVSLIVGAIRTLAETTGSPANMLEGLNRQLHGRLKGGFATCVALRLDRAGVCTIATAGHPAPFLNRVELVLPGSLPLGILDNTSYEEFPQQLSPGDHLSLYTDGLLEARNAAGEVYGFDRLTILFGNQASAEQASAEAAAFGQEDDVTVLTLTWTGAPTLQTA